MTLCALCRRDIHEHSESELYTHLKKLSKFINESEVLKDYFPWIDGGIWK